MDFKAKLCWFPKKRVVNNYSAIQYYVENISTYSLIEVVLNKESDKAINAIDSTIGKLQIINYQIDIIVFAL